MKERGVTACVAALVLSTSLAYYAHLFAARAQRALGKLDAAAVHLRVARGLFPQAQSAMVAESALALQRGDAAAATAVLQQLRDLPSDPSRRLDPWWQYDQGPGRNADAILTVMWTHARTLGK